jgi:uncharacterized membrane protein
MTGTAAFGDLERTGGPQLIRPLMMPWAKYRTKAATTP